MCTKCKRKLIILIIVNLILILITNLINVTIINLAVANTITITIPIPNNLNQHNRPPRRLPIPQRLRACSQVCDFVPGVGGRAHEVLTIAFHTGNVSFQTCNCCLDGLSSLFLHLCVSLAQLYLSCLRGALPHTA